MRRVCLWGLLVALIPAGAEAGFKEDQLRHARVRTAFDNHAKTLARSFRERGLPYPPQQIFIRALKKEKRLEVWAHNGESFSHFRTYPFCYASGTLGPKRMQGDEQVPEGIYTIDRFNPVSSYHLSLGINYPNRSDRILGKRGMLGGDIFVHGDCVSIGCIAITNEKIEEVFVLAVEAKNAGQKRIPVHIFPSRLDANGMLRLRGHAKYTEHRALWEGLSKIFQRFESTRQIPRVRIQSDGAYSL